MKGDIPTTEERFRRHQRDRKVYRQRSLFRRSHSRFRRDLKVLPYLFLARGVTFAAPLRQSWDEMIEALRGRAIWTLDTASRLTCGIGFLTAQDLTAYLDRDGFEELAAQDIVEELHPAFVSLDPPLPRPPVLVVHVATEPPPSMTLPSGDLVVPWDRMIRDLIGTLGWRPDLLNRVEDAYLRTEGALEKTR